MIGMAPATMGRTASGVDRLRFGLIGYGLWGRHHAEAIVKAPGAELAAIACVTDKTAAAARERFPHVPVYRDMQALLGDASIEAVDIVVPNHLHEEIGIAALEAGKHVLLEKPMALTVAACDRLIAAAAACGKVLTIGHEFRLSTQWGSIKSLIDEGAIGSPLYANVSLYRFPYRQGSGGWRYDRDRVGSWILEEPVHFFDSVMWYFEKLGDPASLLAFGNARPDDDKAAAQPGMAHNFSTVLRWAGGEYAIITQTLAGFEHHHVMEIVGSEGSIRTWWSGAEDRTREPSFELKVQRAGAQRADTLRLGASGELFELDEELRLAVEAFRNNKPLVSGQEARKRILCCLAAERALAENREIALDFSHAGDAHAGRAAQGTG
jgi:myo-inositol 2-dehydrogenase/D-chiro-inositol 1-dehydrogenase